MVGNLPAPTRRNATPKFTSSQSREKPARHPARPREAAAMAARPSDNKPQTGLLPHFPQPAGGRADRVAPVFFFQGFLLIWKKTPSYFRTPCHIESVFFWSCFARAQLVSAARKKPSALIACLRRACHHSNTHERIPLPETETLIRNTRVSRCYIARLSQPAWSALHSKSRK